MSGKRGTAPGTRGTPSRKRGTPSRQRGTPFRRREMVPRCGRRGRPRRRAGCRHRTRAAERLGSPARLGKESGAGKRRSLARASRTGSMTFRSPLQFNAPAAGGRCVWSSTTSRVLLTPQTRTAGQNSPHAALNSWTSSPSPMPQTSTNEPRASADGACATTSVPATASVRSRCGRRPLPPPWRRPSPPSARSAPATPRSSAPPIPPSPTGSCITLPAARPTRSC